MKAFLIGITLAGTFLIGALFGSTYESHVSWTKGKEVYGAFYSGHDLRGWDIGYIKRADDLMDTVLVEFNKLNEQKPLKSGKLPRHQLGYMIQYAVTGGDHRPFLLFVYPGPTKKELVASVSISELDLDPALPSHIAKRTANDLYEFILQKSVE